MERQRENVKGKFGKRGIDSNGDGRNVHVNDAIANERYWKMEGISSTKKKMDEEEQILSLSILSIK